MRRSSQGRGRSSYAIPHRTVNCPNIRCRTSGCQPTQKKPNEKLKCAFTRMIKVKKRKFFFSRVENVLHRNTFKIRDLSANNDSARLKQRKTGRTKAQKYREDSSTAKRPSVERTARLETPLGRSSEYFDVALRPGEDVPRQSFASAGRQVLDLTPRKFPVPYVQICQLAHICLRGVEASAQRVLWEQVEMLLLEIRDTSLMKGRIWLKADSHGQKTKTIYSQFRPDYNQQVYPYVMLI